MTIWDSICHSQWFKQTSIVNCFPSLSQKNDDELLINRSSDQILFLNKNDIFERKILTSNIKSFFPVSSAYRLLVYDYEKVYDMTGFLGFRW